MYVTVPVKPKLHAKIRVEPKGWLIALLALPVGVEAALAGVAKTLERPSHVTAAQLSEVTNTPAALHVYLTLLV